MADFPLEPAHTDLARVVRDDVRQGGGRLSHFARLQAIDLQLTWHQVPSGLRAKLPSIAALLRVSSHRQQFGRELACCPEETMQVVLENANVRARAN